MSHILYFVVIAAVFLILSRVMPGVRVEGWGPALVAALVLGVLNVLVAGEGFEEEGRGDRDHFVWDGKMRDSGNCGLL